LNVFHAYGNKLSGEIPNTIGNLQESLRHLVLSENDFTGELPEAINFMHVLQDLSIHQTTNTYGGLTGLLPSFSDCYALTSLNLSGNSIGGELPSDFLVNSDHRDDVYIEVDLSSNYFEGHIPQSWNIFSYLNLDLSNNLIDHVASSLCENDYWQDGYLGESENDCNFLLCDRYSYNAQGRATESMPCAHCDSAEYFGATFCQNENVNNLSILEALHASTNGGNWINSLGWFTSNNVCDGWHGIYCDDDGIDIVRIDLSNNGLTGTPSTKLFNLPKLKELSLDENSINFSFDGIGAATKLEVLYLSQTRITSLDGIGKAKSLKELHLTECYLEGPLPHELFSLFNLEAIFMNYNQFSGRIPPAIGQLTKLKKLYLMSNQLKGNIPATIGDLSNLQVLSLTDNAFSGTLPSTLNNLINIEILAIEHERRNKNSIKNRRLLQGVGLTGKLPSFDGLENLQQILLGFNSLTGSIPYSFLDGISDKSQPLKIDLEYNLLEGNVPSSLTQFSEVSVSLQGNKFTGIAPGVCKMTKWNDGDVLDNSCDGILCPINMFSPIGRTSPEAKCESCPAFTASLYLGAIECSTDDEQYEKEEMKILQNLYNNLNGNGWYSQDNWYNEDVSFCLWYGIICAPGETDSIEAIRLPNNDLVGQLPSEIYNLPNLKELNLGGNKIAMTYNGIEKASKLKFMNIDNLGLNNMSGIEASPSLRILHAASNQFVNFPYEVKSLSNLEVLYLSSNKFNIDLPDLSGLTQLSYLECKECALTGKVPSWLGIMTSLQYLSLSGNMLTGIIPNELNNLKLLEHLDLSEQTPRGGGLTGELPSFSTLEHLSNLYLNRNKLSGQIDPSFLQNTNVISVSVDLRYNELSGGIPNIFTQRFDDISLLMAENKIDAIPDGCDFDTYDLGWNQGDVRQFGCDALLCEPGFFSPIGRKTSGNRYNCEVCDVAEVDSYYGSTTCGVIPAKVVLESIYNALGGPDWTNNDLWMENDLICEWYGVVCDDNYERVIGLDLENNGLVGPVPSSIYTLTELNMINLKKNKVSFPFGGINQLVNLHSLNLSDNGLESVDGLKEALSLKALHLTGNSLKSIPDDIYSLVNLEELYMNYNDMEGSISSKIGQLSALRELFMFRNKLSGNIPAEIGKLQNLRTLGLGKK
jgi:Leucine-rich repeat (LRR) protein